MVDHANVEELLSLKDLGRLLQGSHGRVTSKLSDDLLFYHNQPLVYALLRHCLERSNGIVAGASPGSILVALMDSENFSAYSFISPT